MNFWDKIQKDMKRNIKEGLEFMREGSTAVSQRLEKLTEDGKKKYKIFNLNMKVQEEFAKLGGQIYDLTTKKSKNPLGNRKVNAIISKINKLEAQITKLEKKSARKTVKKTTRKSTIRSKSPRQHKKS